MSATGDQDPTQAGQEGPVSPEGAGDGMSRDSGPQGVAGPAAGLREEEVELAAALAGALEGGDAEEGLNIPPAEADRREMAAGRNMIVNAHQLPTAGFRFMFLDLVYSVLQRIYFNDHILIRPRGGGHPLLMRRRPQSPEDLVDPPPLVVPQRLALRVMSGDAEVLTEAAASIGEPEEPAEGAMAAQDLTELAEQDIVQPAEEVTEEAEVPKECIMYYSEEVTQDKYDNWNDDVEDADGEGEKEEEKKAEEENKENGKEEP